MTIEVSGRGAPKGRVISIDWFRGIAILFVVFSHISGSPPFIGPILRNGTVFFVLISGFMYSVLGHSKERFRTFLARKISTLALPWVVASSIGLVAKAAIGGGTPLFLLLSLATGVGHYNDAHWYIPMILVIFASQPLLSRLESKPGVLIAVMLCFLALSLFSYRSFNNQNPLWNALHFFGIFLLGMALGNWRDAFFRFLDMRFMPIQIVGSAILVWLACSESSVTALTWETGVLNLQYTLNYQELAKVILFLQIFALLRKAEHMGLRLRVLVKLSEMSFGLFFWHLYFKLFVTAGIPLLFHNPLPAFWLFWVETFFVLGGTMVFLTMARLVFGTRSSRLFGY